MKLVTMCFLLATGLRVFSQELRPGIYEGDLTATFQIGVSAEGIATGFYEDYTGENQQFSCVIFFSGKMTGVKFTILDAYSTRETDTIGVMEILDSTSFKITGEQPGGCWNVEPNIGLMKDKGLTFHRIEPRSWKAIRMVSADKAFFYREPNLGTKRKTYVIKSNILHILETRADWVRAEFQGPKSTTTGWIQEEDLQ